MIGAALSIVLVALQVLDWSTTIRVLAAGGRELNPVMAWLVVEFGWRALLAAKLAGAALIIWLALSHDLAWAVAVVDAAYAWVCWHNWKLAQRLRSAEEEKKNGKA